jgi:hypothetical protein
MTLLKKGQNRAELSPNWRYSIIGSGCKDMERIETRAFTMTKFGIPTFFQQSHVYLV